jgi:hypothetical protein
MKWKSAIIVLSAGLLALVVALPSSGADDRGAAEGIIIIDSKGKENKVKGWQIVQGTRRLSWLAPAEPEKKPEEKPNEKDAPPPKKPAAAPMKPVARGPEALSFRDDNSTVWVQGVLTLIPLETIRAIEYDTEKDTATVKVAGAKPEEDISLSGTTRFANVNKLTIEADVDKGELGIASVKFQGGIKMGGIKGVKFASPKPAVAPKGRTAKVTILQSKGKNTSEEVTDLQALYLTGSGEKASPILLFKKTIKLDVNKVSKLVVLSDAAKDKETEMTVTLKDGNEETLTLLDSGDIDGTLCKLEGFLARVPAGWKLFHPTVIKEISFVDEK